MEGANADSDHSMTWEDFFGSTTDLAPTLIEIYDSLLDPTKKTKPDSGNCETAKDARNDPPVTDKAEAMTETVKEDNILETSREPTVECAPVLNKSSLYPLRTKIEVGGASDKCNLSSELTVKDMKHRGIQDTKLNEPTSFDTLSPNVKRMISIASETTALKLQKKPTNVTRSSTRLKSNIPLVGATSKISQSGVTILPSVDIYDQPLARNFVKSKSEDNEASITKTTTPRVEFKLNDDSAIYDVPNNNRPTIYDIPNSNNKTAFESLSLPYIDQSIDLSLTSNDREFDPKISPKEPRLSPQKTEFKKPSPEGSPSKIPKTNGTKSVHTKDLNKNESPSKNLIKTPPYPPTRESVNNLKSAIPEKEVVRLNPVVEVTRPLSMSSIASSSSTSSSGVQNKGGVNSAYLASIESLDDHSEADMTSANNSNNFVNNAGLANVEERTSEGISRQETTDETSEMSQLERVCAEIVQTENIYVEDLRQVVEGYLHVWRRENTFSSEELSELFNNIEDIYAFNRSLCDELNTCRLDATCIARCFVNNTVGFTIYTSYCTGYPRTMQVLAELASREESARQFRERQAALFQPLPLASYLLKPVQRILKYHLLLQNVVKQCASRDTQYAFLKMTGIAQHIDDMKKRHEHAVRVQEIQSLLYGWNGPDLTTYGELCAEGTFRVFGAKAMRHAFLFDKMLLVTKNREDGILAYKSHIMCNNMMLVESLSGAPLSFQVIPWDVPRSQLTLQARSARHKREWTLLLKRVILENYNAVIPSHARQLVMELGQNKTDDDILAEKSHNLISQASMRKQLSAPEYLEKRKLERERRKAFEINGRGRLKKNNRKLTLPMTKNETSNDCDCAQISEDKGTDYTCDNCYVDLCSDCDTEVNKAKKDITCKHEDSFNAEKCPDCDKRLHYIDAGSTEHLERRPSICKCSDFKSSQESFSKDSNSSLNKTRGYHSSDNIISYIEKSKEDLNDTNNSLVNIRNIPKSCLKCEQIKENIAVTEVGPIRKSRCLDAAKARTDTFRSKSKDDPHRSRLSKIGTWRRKSEPGLPQNISKMSARKSNENDNDRIEGRGGEKIEFECRNCGSKKISKKGKSLDVLSDPETENRTKNSSSNLEMKVYTTKNMPKKISKLKKNRSKSIKLDNTAKFYTDFPTDISTENILHISESNDSLNVDKPVETISHVSQTISKDEDIDEETYKKLIEKTDSFKKNELEKVKYLNKQKVISEGPEVEEKTNDTEENHGNDIIESCEESEQPLEHIISQLLLQNREFQKLLKKQQQRNSSQRRHQRLLKSHSNPEPTNDDENHRLQLTKQISENLEVDNEVTNGAIPNPLKEHHYSEEDHIYETLRVEPRIDENLHQLNIKRKTIQHPIPVVRPKRLPSPPNVLQNGLQNYRASAIESDYVYLSFDKLNNLQDQDGIYDIPVKSPVKVATKTESDYIVMQNQGTPKKPTEDVVYDSLVEVTRRKKDVPNTLPNDYLPMSPDHQSPNTPEIWLSRQKEHFTVSRDRKSGSLPRSFQVVLNSQEEDNLSSFICKPNTTGKTYLNRDGKVMSTDRPFTIASDQSELSYEDVENYMSDGDILKFNKSPTSKDANFEQALTRSTLELEEEIDRCYKNNFEKIKIESEKIQNIMTSETNLNASVMSSCEVLSVAQNETPQIVEIVHPEHKIYKPTGNMLSLKNVLNRFRSRTPNKHSDDNENSIDKSSPESAKSDIKSPTSEKKSALNPKNYSKNLLQRFRNIIGDEHTDDNCNMGTAKKVEEQINSFKNEIKVVITSTDASSTTSSIVYSTKSDVLSTSVYENTTLSESQNEKNNLEMLSHSCDNIMKTSEILRPRYEKSVSVPPNRSSTGSSTTNRSSGSVHNLNKLPIYKQGSKHLGARIAQSDYADPITLSPEKNISNNVNVLINKNSVRPDSLFSMTSYVTSSSESAYQEVQKVKEHGNKIETKDDVKNTKVTVKPDDYSEKTFKKLEEITGEYVFRDSAVYSDQEENEDAKVDVTDSIDTKTTAPLEKVQNSFKAQHTVITNCQSKIVSITNNKSMVQNKVVCNTVTEPKIQLAKTVKPKIAPPVPVKPKVTSIPTANNKFNLNKTSISENQESVSSEMHLRTLNRNTSSRKTISTSKLNDTKAEDVTTNLKPQGNIQLKRLSFERASLDSATRRLKANDVKKTSETANTTTKTVLERRLELEKLTKTQIVKPQTMKKPTHITRPKTLTTKVAPFERSISDINDKKDVKHFNEKPTASSSISSINIESKIEANIDSDLKGSWVKQVVNKFQ